MRVSISAIGSITLISSLSLAGQKTSSAYQDALTTPGIIPLSACSRKQMRQSWNLRMYPLGRPHILQRLRTRTGYFRRVSRMMMDFFAMVYDPFVNGMPISCSMRRPSWSFRAEVTIVTSNPRTLSILSY